MAKSASKVVSTSNAPAKTRKPATKKTTLATVTEISVSQEQVAELAHRFFAERGYQHGHAEEDWYRAEQALRKKAS